MKRPVRIVLCGAAGRMGRRISELAARDPRVAIAAGITFAKRSMIADALAAADVLVDFTAPAASVTHAQAAAKAKVPAVIGTTGHSNAQLKRLKSLSRKTAVLLAPNCSPGMNLLFELARIAAAALPSYDAGITETHHTRKKDAPSGSAKRLAASVRAARRGGAQVPTVSLRLGNIVGEHSLTLAGPEEVLELSHRAQARSVFARGALEAALWVRGKRPGLYSMKDLLFK